MSRRMNFSPWVAAWLVALCVAATATQAADDRPNVRVLEDLTYVQRESGPLKLDLYLPRGDEVEADEAEADPPLIVWIHGGGWVGGDKSPNPLAGLAAEGYAVASIRYRFTDVAPHPAQHHDCQAAIRWLRQHADEHGYDGERIGAVGGSAGGHLVGLLATAADEPELAEPGVDTSVSAAVQVAVSFAGPMDLPLIARDDPHEMVPPLLEPLIGGTIDEQESVAEQASPITHVHADAAPLLLIQGDADTLVPPRQAEVMHAAMQEAGATSELLILKNVGHDAGLIDTDVRQIMKDFLAEHLSR